MDHINSLFGPVQQRLAHPKPDRRTERGELMKYFLERLNPRRVRDGFRPLTYPRMGKLLQGLSLWDLHYLKRVCDDSNDFSKRFWWELDPKKHK